MKLKFLLLAFTLSAITSAYAGEPAPCSRFIGSWYGSFWLKDPRECRIYRGCTHSMLAVVTHTGGTHYSAAVHPKIGREGIYDLTCENGNVKATEKSGAILFTCIDRTICQVKYDDEQLSANLLSSGA